jgi:exodeoxyribonuclease VII small subunit
MGGQLQIPYFWRECAMAKKKSEKKLTFEEARAQLETIAAAVEQGDIGLEELVAHYEKGKQLEKYCRTLLAEAEAKIQKLQLAEDGSLTPEPMETPPANNVD